MSTIASGRAFDGHVQPYAVAYNAAHPGREFRGHEYIVWISQQWRAWGEETGTDLSKPKTPAVSDAFGAWLRDRWVVQP